MLAWPARVRRASSSADSNGPAVDPVVQGDDADDVAHAAHRDGEHLARVGLTGHRLELGRPGTEPAAHALAAGDDLAEHTDPGCHDRRRRQPGLVQAVLRHQLQPVGRHPQHDAGPALQGDHRGLEHHLQQPVEVVGAGQGVADAFQGVAQVLAAALQRGHAPAQLVGHLVERAAEPPGLAVRRGGDRGVEVTARDALGGLGDLGVGLAQPAGHDRHQDAGEQGAAEQDEDEQVGPGRVARVLRGDHGRPRQAVGRRVDPGRPALDHDQAVAALGGARRVGLVASSSSVEKTTVAPSSSTTASAALRVRRSVSSSRSSRLTTTASPSPVVSPTRACRCARTGLVASPDASPVHGGQVLRIGRHPGAAGRPPRPRCRRRRRRRRSRPRCSGPGRRRIGAGVTAEGQGGHLDGEAERAALVDQLGTYGGSRAVDVAGDPVGPRVGHDEQQHERSHGERHEEQPAEHQPQPPSKAHGLTAADIPACGHLCPRCPRLGRWPGGRPGGDRDRGEGRPAGSRPRRAPCSPRVGARRRCVPAH